jgi:hypothetical protein
MKLRWLEGDKKAGDRERETRQRKEADRGRDREGDERGKRQKET